MIDLIAALRELNEHPDTVIAVVTGEGRFFSSGADIRGMQVFSESSHLSTNRLFSNRAEPARVNPVYPNAAAKKKVDYLSRFSICKVPPP